MRNRGLTGWLLAAVLTGFYILLYWTDQFTPFSKALFGQDKWFLYGLLYTIAILVMGARFLQQKKKSRYQVLRTLSVMFCQLLFAFTLPFILAALSSETPYYAKDLKNIWPLQYYFFDSWHLKNMLAGGPMGVFFLAWGVALIVLVTPLLTWLFGKRWYCSWVCGCGGLAETAGDPFRHLSDKSFKAWKIERWLIHGVLVFIIVTTALVLFNFFTGRAPVAYNFSKWYGFLIGAAFSGVIGVGFYPLLGSRVWCRFGCPQAAILGIFQKTISRFRITTNGNMCMECGLCSKYCEMGIDIRAYSQKGRDIKRASCVGCGICAWVCPRGVLRLETK